MAKTDTRARELVDFGLQRLRQGDVTAAIEQYESAREFAVSEETLELITIRKAEALLSAESDGPEIALLPEIVMRRRSARHVYLASYVLLRKYADMNDHHSEPKDRRRAMMYGDLARRAAEELGDSRAIANVLNGLGMVLTQDSRFEEAIRAFEEALELIPEIEDRNEARILRAFVCGGLGGAQILNGHVENGVMLIEEAMHDYEDDYCRAESYVDLAFGYMHLDNNERATANGLRALKCAVVPRQARNANHVLAELASRAGRYEEASKYYDVVASFYPDFKNVKELLLAVDVLSVVNWKA